MITGSPVADRVEEVRRRDWWLTATLGRTGLRSTRTQVVAGAAVVVVIGMGTALLLRSFRLISPEPIWAWALVLGAIAILVAVAPPWMDEHPGRRRLLVQMTGLTILAATATYLTGWGPILITAIATVSVVTVICYGPDLWHWLVAVGLGCVLLAQIGIAIHLVPTELSLPTAEGVVALGFLIYVVMVGLTVYAAREIKASGDLLQSSEERFRSLIQYASDTTMLVSEDGSRITYVSPACKDLVGSSPERLVGRCLLPLVHPEDRDRVAALLTEQGPAQPVVQFEFRMPTVDGGAVRQVEAVMSDMRGNPAVGGLVFNLRDISKRKAAEAQLAYAALHDTLTGLANRALVLDRTEQLLARSRRRHRGTAVLSVDLDNFKDVNDSLGHAAGDSLLRQVSRRLVASVRESDTVGRMGGDEFVVLLDEPLGDGQAELMAAKLLKAVEQPVNLGPGCEYPIAITASIGIATGGRESADVLIGDAEIALCRAKAAGKHCSVLFAPAMAEAASVRLRYESDLHRAVNRSEFFLVYQPLFDLDPVAVYGVEALLRWRHPDRGVISPVEFISALEANGLILEVGGWVLRQACRQLTQWKHEGLDLIMSVNVSMAQFETDQIVADVAEALSAAGCDPSGLVIEITESMLMSDPTAVLQRLRLLKGLGVKIAIDDFGTGYSSLAYLRQFPVDELKIDQTFISSILESREANVIVKSFVELGEALGIETLAEGIEDYSQLEILQGVHCLRGQGFLVSRPLAADALVEFLDVWLPVPENAGSRSEWAEASRDQAEWWCRTEGVPTPGTEAERDRPTGIAMSSTGPDGAVTGSTEVARGGPSS